jgi:hypothetical protein
MRGECGPSSGALFVFEASERGSCDRLFPAKVYSQEGGIQEFERPLRPWAIGTHYEVGDRVRLDCRSYEAAVEHDASNVNVPIADAATWTPVGGLAPVKQ